MTAVRCRVGRPDSTEWGGGCGDPPLPLAYLLGGRPPGLPLTHAGERADEDVCRAGMNLGGL